jgi:hypothetical protein
MYLRCLVGGRMRQWLQWLPWAEFCYNTTFHSSIHKSPFRVVFGHDPPLVHSYMPGDAKLPVVHHQLMDRDEFLQEIKECLEQARNLYKMFYDKGHRELEFQVGKWVWLRLQHRPLASLDIKGPNKLGTKYFGVYHIRSVWVTWLTDYICQREPSYVMFSTYAC